ncbi:MAG: SUMF1/EgtB/PvdO family nonheme iron enzyme [Bacteroidales bacterium]|nr:SUMF1/EgtB/PvdO family nonheme iron enzyme [Bacteroidales bacterium]
MKRTFFLLLLFLLHCNCFAQFDSLVVKVGDVRFVMIKIEAAQYQHLNYIGDTVNEDIGINPLESLKKDNGYSTFVLDAYYIGKYEVTQELYTAVMGKNPSWHKGKQLPVNCISWYDANRFIDSLNKRTGMHFRLPTEAEWEYAASGNHWEHKYSGGDIRTDVGWVWENSGHKSRKVGLKPANEFGLYDMSGNAHEWCSDWLSSYYYKPGKTYKNPQGPTNGTHKIIKGGNWASASRMLEYRTRTGKRPNTKDAASGFRLAMDVEK